MKSTSTIDDSGRPMKYKSKNKSKFTCIPIGLTQGQFNLNAFKIAEQYKWFQMRSACLMAFCHLYIQDPFEWSSQTINKILINGAKVVKDNYEHVKDNGPLDCVLNVETYVAKIQIEEPLFLDTIESSISLVDTLQTFFNDHQHGLFRCLNLCYLIWKSNEIYFIFDGQGSGSAAEDRNGYASLVCTQSLRDIGKLIKTLSSTKSNDCYSLSAINMKHFREGVSNYTKPRIQYVVTNPYRIVDECFAILSGKFHVGHSGFQALKKRQSMAINLMALIYHTIQPANSWNSQLIDKIILLGTKLFHECKKSSQGEVTIQHLPRSYSVPKYKFKIEYRPYDHSGQMSYSLDEIEKNLLMYLQRALVGTAKKAAVFIQTNSLVLAVWESNNYFYLFDAYARNQVGEVADDQLGMPCVHLHGSLESLCNILATNLNAIASNDEFVLHGINVTLLTNDNKAVSDADLESITTIMDDLFWAEMNNFQESSARSEEICNLNESSDDDIFMETVGDLKRTVSSIDSSESRSTTSSESEATHSRTESASTNESHANTRSNDESDSQDGKSKKVRSKSPKNHINTKEDATETEEQMMNDDEVADAVDKRQQEEEKKKKRKEKKAKKSKDGSDGGTDEQKKQGNKEKNKGKDGCDGGSDVGTDEQKKQGIEEKNKGKDKEENIDKDGKSKQALVVVESSSGSETSITKLLTTSFKISDRVLLATEWGDFFVAQENNSYFLIDGCLCDYNALVQINLSELDSSKRVHNIDGIISKIMQTKSGKSVTIRSETGDVKDIAVTARIDEVEPPFSSGVDAPMWELIEGMIELMKTTAKFDKIKSELV